MFDFSIDYAAIFKIVMIDILLGADNAIVIALAVMGLSPALQKQGIFWGTAGAVGLRAVMLILAGWMLSIPYLSDVLKVAGAGYLGYLAATMGHDEGEHNVAQADTLRGAVWTIIVADFAMSLDNVLAVISAAQSAGEHSTIYAIAGIILSIPIIVWGSKGVIAIMERFPVLVDFGAALLAYVALEMLLSATFIWSIPHTNMVIAGVLAGVVTYLYRRQERAFSLN